jgi:DNA-binding NarL/FixJ family response regulator
VRKLGLSDRQTEVLRLILQGMSNKLIGRQLQLAEGTVKVHVSAVLRALGVRNRTQAVLAANRLGLRLPE